MKRIALGMVLALSLMVSAAYAEAPSNNINFFIGQKTFHSDWEDTDYGDFSEQPEFGILLDFKGQDWPVSLAIELMGSAKKDDGVTFASGEVGIGIKKIWEGVGTPIKPFVGAGINSITAKFEEERYDSYHDEYYVNTIEESGIGYFLEGGIYITIGESLNLGALIRHSYADIDELDINAGGTHTGIFVGYHW